MRVRVDGIPMYVAVRGYGPAITLVHGFPLNHRIYDAQFRGLSHSYRVIVPDLRGFGKTPFGGEDITIDTYADDVAAILDALGVEQTILAGLSMGGYIAFAFWRRHPERVKGLVLLATRAGADSEEARQNRFQTIESVRQNGLDPLIEGMLPKLLAPSTLRGKAHVVRKLRHIMQCSTEDGVVAALRAMAHRPDSRPTLSTITVPTLVVAGREDAIIPLEESEEMALAIPDARLRVLGQAGHLVTMERPRLTTRLLDAFAHEVWS